MAEAAELDQPRASDLELLRSGDFADVVVTCGDRSWNCHQAILASRSDWFRKALSRPFEDAGTRQVSLNKQTPLSVDLALKYIYGLALDVESSVSEDHFVVECVSLCSTASLLKLATLQESVESAVRRYCDKRMKQLCTGDSELEWSPTDYDTDLKPWALDMVLGIRETRKVLGSDVLKEFLVEFLWVGRRWTLIPAIAPTVLSHLEDPDFATDLISWYATGLWLQDPHWAPFSKTEIDDHWFYKVPVCARCGKDMSRQTNEEKNGQVYNPFQLDGNVKYGKGWCKDCGRLDMIPWRDQEANDG